MKTYIFKSKIVLANILFIFVLSVQSKAQDTIFCLDERYYWNEPCNYSDYLGFSASHIDLANIGYMFADFEEPGNPPNLYQGIKLIKF